MSPFRQCWDQRQDTNFPQCLVVLYPYKIFIEINIFAIISLHIERLLARGLLSHSIGKACHGINLAFILLLPIIQILLGKALIEFSNLFEYLSEIIFQSLKSSVYANPFICKPDFLSCLFLENVELRSR